MMRDIAIFVAGCIFGPIAIVAALGAWAVPRIRKDLKW